MWCGQTVKSRYNWVGYGGQSVVLQRVISRVVQPRDGATAPGDGARSTSTLLFVKLTPMRCYILHSLTTLVAEEWVGVRPHRRHAVHARLVIAHVEAVLEEFAAHLTLHRLIRCRDGDESSKTHKHKYCKIDRGFAVQLIYNNCEISIW